MSIFQLLSCLDAFCMCNHCSLLILNLHTSNPKLNQRLGRLSAAPPFAAGLKLLAFRWYTPWGATGAADRVGPGRGARGGATGGLLCSFLFSHPPNFIFGNPGQPRSLKIKI